MSKYDKADRLFDARFLTTQELIDLGTDNYSAARDLSTELATRLDLILNNEHAPANDIREWVRGKNFGTPSYLLTNSPQTLIT